MDSKQTRPLAQTPETHKKGIPGPGNEKHPLLWPGQHFCDSKSHINP